MIFDLDDYYDGVVPQSALDAVIADVCEESQDGSVIQCGNVGEMELMLMSPPVAGAAANWFRYARTNITASANPAAKANSLQFAAPSWLSPKLLTKTAPT